jgi:glycosyltransferase involved in cell wall biosynthesis
MKKLNLSAINPELVKPVSDSPLVSVITPTYRRDLNVVRRCLDCMKLQSIPSWEQFVCSDGEKEPYVESLIQSMGDSRIQYHFTEGKKPGDFGNTVRSEMLKKARGKYVLFFDDDNLILPDYLQDMISALEGTDNDFAVCNIMHFGPLMESEVGKPPKVLTGNPVKLYHIDPLQVLVKRETMQKVGWDTEVGYLSDGVTLEKLGKDYKHVRVEKVLGVHL